MLFSTARLVACIVLSSSVTMVRSTCISASPGYYCTSTSVGQIDCTAGFYCTGGTAPMVGCPAGQTSDIRATNIGECHAPASDAYSPLWALFSLFLLCCFPIYCLERHWYRKDNAQAAQQQPQVTHVYHYGPQSDATAPPQPYDYNRVRKDDTDPWA